MFYWKKCSTLLLCAGVLMLSHGPAFAAGEWEGRLSVKSGSAESRLFFGQRFDATPGVDGQHDVPAMFGGSLKAWFDIAGSPYWRDIQGNAAGQGGQWSFQVESVQQGAAIELYWQVSAAKIGALSLVDLTDGQRIDMLQQNSYRYINQGPRQFKLVSVP